MSRETSLQAYCHDAAMRFPRENPKQLAQITPDMLLHASFRAFFCPNTMRTLSHLIEETVLKRIGITEQLHVSFQSLKRLAPQMARYEHLGNAVMGQWLYGAKDTESLPDLPRTVVVDTRDTGFLGFWWVIARGPGISMCLIGEETPCPLAQGQQYRGFYTCCEQTTLDVLDILREFFPDQVPQPVVRSLIAPHIHADVLSLAGD